MFWIIDNYDSFAHNLARYFRVLGTQTIITRNNDVSVQEVLTAEPTGIVLSPGPCTPREAGVCLDLVAAAGLQTPILGVCLGHQCIAQCHGAAVIRVAPSHGKASLISHDQRGIFQDVPSPFQAGRYHSLAVKLRPGSPLVETASLQDRSGHQINMAIAHKSLPQIGLQFHPESVLTVHGMTLIQNFIDFATAWRIGREHRNAAQ